MAKNKGKVFEQKFKENFEEMSSEAKAIRIYDTQGKRKGVCNICDFVCYNFPVIFLIECKSHKGNSFPIMSRDIKTGIMKPFRQYNKLLEFKDIKGMVVGVVLWLYEKDLVAFISIEELEKMIKDDKRSISSQDIINKTYNIVDIPSFRLRSNSVCLNSDYSVLMKEAHL